MKDFFGRLLSADYLFVIPEKQIYLNLLAAFYISLLVLTLLYVLIYRAKHGKSEILKKFRRRFFWGNISLGLIGIFLVFSRQQGLPLFSLRIFNYLLLFSILAFNIYLAIHYKKNVLKGLFEKKERERLEKWLPKSRKKA